MFLDNLKHWNLKKKIFTNTFYCRYHPGGFCLGGYLNGGILSWGMLSGGYCPGGYCPDTIICTGEISIKVGTVIHTKSFIIHHSVWVSY